ncbi:MAG: aspartate carbamoyltransferase, partial [Firmicutes bacterium HGW-Firmicutes-5]
IRSLKKSINHQVIGLCGDLKFGRTAHSLVKALNKYENIRFIFISPIELTIPEYILEDLDPGSYTLTDNLDEVIDQLDILYMTRIQKERFFNEEEYLRLKGYYILTKDKLATAKEDMIVMHPLPRVDEICSDVDDDPRAVYFKQAKFGMYVRMALILKLLGGA